MVRTDGFSTLPSRTTRPDPQLPPLRSRSSQYSLPPLLRRQSPGPEACRSLRLNDVPASVAPPRTHMYQPRHP